MSPRYYSRRLLNPYRGVLQVIELGELQAQSRDARLWHLKSATSQGLPRQLGIWQDGRGLITGQPQVLQDLIAAIESRPEVPFEFDDVWECWLLDHQLGCPLALLAADRYPPDGRPPPEPEWMPFLPSYTAFSSLLLVERDALTPYGRQNHRDVLARLVNRAARPQPRAQWFRRTAEGDGEGVKGVRLPPEWRNRRLAKVDFPELLVREDWNSRLETSVIADYHAHLSPLLLCWPRLCEQTRSRLELLACERPLWLARVQHMLTVQIHPQQLRAALVAARLSQASDDDMKPWIDD